ncbi:MAG: GreA/GreB family elongation factor [Candidatus Falkowbacteria bacterium]|nr:GreA/GreB family elongation factor [Candidatus Falkowbacteria bacterium]
MQVPTRRADKLPRQKSDPHLTPEKFRELTDTLKKLKEVKRPREAAEVKRLAEMGDFSENAGYQMAKSRLRGINKRIDEISDLLTRAEIISPNNSGKIELGNLITLAQNGKQKKYRLLGSVETDPQNGIISHNSPLGEALLGKRVGDQVKISPREKIIEYKIISIE